MANVFSAASYFGLRTNTTARPRCIGQRGGDKELQELDQYEMFARISGANFGNLLFKDWKGDKLTKGEAEIIEKLNSDEAVRFAAFGIYCTHGGVNAKNVLLQAQQKNHGSMPYGS